MKSNGLNLYRGIVEQGFEYLVITFSSSHFFNKTDLKQFFFEEILLEIFFFKKENYLGIKKVPQTFFHNFPYL